MGAFQNISGVEEIDILAVGVIELRIAVILKAAGTQYDIIEIEFLPDKCPHHKSLMETIPAGSEIDHFNSLITQRAEEILQQPGIIIEGIDFIEGRQPGVSKSAIKSARRLWSTAPN